MTAFVDTNVLIRHLTGDPADMARRASAYLADADELLLPDIVLAEVVYVLESFYRVQRPEIARLTRSIVTFGPVRVVDEIVLLRAIEVYEVHGLDFADAYLVASAETSGVREIASFERAIDRVASAVRVEP